MEVRREDYVEAGAPFTCEWPDHSTYLKSREACRGAAQWKMSTEVGKLLNVQGDRTTPRFVCEAHLPGALVWEDHNV